jgi:hypothetical protein
MRTTSAILAIVLLAVSQAWAQKIEPIRRGWNAFNGTPYNFCSWLVVSGPEVAKRNILEQAKKSYSEPDATRLAAVEGKVFVEILTLTERSQRCSNRIMKEVIFVDKQSDKPALRLPLESKDIAMSNGFGATWTANNGLGIAAVADFRSALGKGKYHLVVVYEDGGTERIGQGAGQTVWSGDETGKIR